MSPVGRPTDDGDIVQGSRHYRGATLGTASIWKCPACLKENQGRAVEQGCAHCGAGDPTKSKAGKPPVRPTAETGRDVPPPSHPLVRVREADAPPTAGRKVEALRVYRLIEYAIKPGKDVRLTLRNSLVGTIEMDWGTLTGTIVDSIDVNQQDRLRMAKMQPGVWLGNEPLMKQALQQWRPTPTEQPQWQVNTVPVTGPDGERMERVDLPDTTTTLWTGLQQDMARAVSVACGHRYTNTLALALSSIAQELQGNSEPEKFLSSEECLAFANALLAQVPDDWLGELPASAPAGESSIPDGDLDIL